MSATRSITVSGACQGCGVSLTVNRGPSRPRKWCSERCRKQTLYSGECVDCGAPTNGSNGAGAAGKRCAACAARHNHEERHWTRERIIEALRAFADQYGRSPRANDPSLQASHQWPCSSIVVREFGTWNAGIEATGLEAMPVGHKTLPSERQLFVAQVVDLYRGGLSLAAVGRRVGFSSNGVRHVLVGAGEPRRPARRPRKNVAV